MLHLHRIVPTPTKTFLLRGPRGTSKSTWLADAFPRALTIDLLDSSRFLALSRDPASLGRLVAPLLRPTSRHTSRRRSRRRRSSADSTPSCGCSWPQGCTTARSSISKTSRENRRSSARRSSGIFRSTSCRRPIFSTHFTPGRCSKGSPKAPLNPHPKAPRGSEWDDAPHHHPGLLGSITTLQNNRFAAAQHAA